MFIRSSNARGLGQNVIVAFVREQIAIILLLRTVRSLQRIGHTIDINCTTDYKTVQTQTDGVLLPQ